MTITMLAEHHLQNSSGALYWTAMNNTLSVGGQKFLKTLSKVLFSRIKFRHLFYIFNIINYCVYEHYLTENVQIFHILIQKIALNTLHIVLSPTA